MMDPSTEEMLSRYLDGNLDARDTEALEARLDSEPQLRSELEALGRLRDAVASLADRMEPPAELDALVIPLPQEVPRRAAPTALRWLGMAAALVLGVTVAVEVARKSPAPIEETLAPRREQVVDAPAPNDKRQPEPPPKSDVASEDRSIGASDRLLASPPRERELNEAEGMEEIGPVADENNFADEDRELSSRSKKQSVVNETGHRTGSSQDRIDAAGSGPVPRPAAAQMRAPKGELAATQQERMLVLSTDSGELVAQLPIVALAVPIGAEFEIVVDGELVSEARAIASVEGSSGKSAGELVGIPTPGVADGRYHARITEDDAPPENE